MYIYTYIYNDTPQTGKWCKKKKPQAFGVINININKIYVLTMPSIQECVYHKMIGGCEGVGSITYSE